MCSSASKSSSGAAEGSPDWLERKRIAPPKRPAPSASSAAEAMRRMRALIQRTTASIRAEDIHLQLHAPALKVVVELRDESGRDELASDFSPLPNAFLLEREDVLQGDDVHLHPGDFSDEADLPAAVRQAALLHDDLNRRRDLLSNG